MTDYAHPEIDTGKDAATRLSADLVTRLRTAIPRGVALWIRQSSSRQKRENIGSALFQQGQLSYLKHHGIDPEEVEEFTRKFDARGHSGREGVERPNFEDLLEKIRAGEIGVVIVAWIDRAARNERDSNRLYSALAANGGLVVEKGNIYDPANDTHRFMLGIQSLLAWFQNAQRTLRQITSKAALVQKLAYRIALPRGLCWASPDDELFVQRLEEAGLGDAVSVEALQQHKAQSRREGRNYFIFPYPDAEIQQAIELTVQWLLESRDLREVVRRIAEDPAWPRPSQFPATLSRLFRPSDGDGPVSRDELWESLVDRADGRDDLARGVVKEWLKSLALYGIYSYDLPSLREKSPAAADAIGATIHEENAFPPLIDPDLRSEILSILSSPLDAFHNASYEGPRNHLLSNIRCAGLLPNGERCEVKLQPAYRSARNTYRYIGTQCGGRGHQGDFSSRVDDVVLEIVETAYCETQLAEALELIQERRGVATRQRQAVTRDIDRLSKQVESASRQVEEAESDRSPELTKHWNRRLDSHLKQYEEKRNQLRRLDRQIERAGSLTETDVQRLRDLSSDIPRVLKMAGELEHRSENEEVAGLRRRIVDHLVKEVHAQNLGFRCHQVTVEFPSGVQCSRVLFTRVGFVPQPAAAFAYYHLDDWAEARNRTSAEQEETAVTKAYSTAVRYNTAFREADRTPEQEWDAARALTAALQFTHRDSETPRSQVASHETLEQLSNRLGISRSRVLVSALAGELGPARICNGALVFRPTPGEIHTAFPSMARHSVAESAGWDPEDTVLLSWVRREKGWSWKETRDQARRWSGIVRDEAGRRYVRRSRCSPKARELFHRELNEHLPAGTVRASGSWRPLPEVADEFEVHRNTVLRRRTEGVTAVRPGRGYCGSRSVYVWVDRDLISDLSDV